MEKVVYIKKLDDYDEITNIKFKMPLTFKKLIFLFKNIFNKITIKQSEEFNIWILPFQEKITDIKLEKCIKKQIKKKNITENIKIVIADSLLKHNLIEILDKNNIEHFDGNKIKKILVLKVLDYINSLQKKELNTRNITILVDENNKINNYIINNIALNCKTTKVVSKKIYKFKELEQRLYDDYGIALQFSNSYKKSLLNSEIIINLDFDESEVNEYDINNSAIIINTENPLKIKSKLFSGIVINSYRIKFLKELREEFSKNNLLHRFDNLILYESIMDWKKNDYVSIDERIQDDKVMIINLIGNNGIINKKEFKIVK